MSPIERTRITLVISLVISASTTAISTTAIAAGSQVVSTSTTRTTAAARRSGVVIIDGTLDEAAWILAPPSGDFWQREPYEGKPPQHQTELRVLYDDEAIYVGVLCHDDQPTQIRQMLSRRDTASPSDWVEVGIDSYHDRRTAFVFAVNPAGVQRDYLVFNDVEMDNSWDAVWTAAARVGAKGWVAEFRIPFSQLRFTREDKQTWGFQVMRLVARSNERTTWTPWPKASSQLVSLFGAVEGIQGIQPPRRMEFLPYAVTGVNLQPRIDDADPFARSADLDASLGIDFKYGLGNNFTIAATINPDFGQVEADPSEVNLSIFETFFAEKRPFFLEGTDIFQFSLSQGDLGVEQLFYSRRIGRTPQGLDDDDLGEYSSAPDATTIYTAAKLSGKTKSGWSVGMLDAITAEEQASIDDGTGTRTTKVLEPLTNYGVLRVKKDLNGGATSLGAILTAVNRALDGTGVTTLHDQAYTGGLQFGHRFAGNQYSVDARLVTSYVHGPATAIDETQRAPQRYYQRPDATHLHYDPTRTSLAGAGLLWSAGKSGGDHVRFTTGGDLRSPGLELNDIGFLQFSDNLSQWVWGQYRDDQPSEYLQSYNVDLNGWVGSDTDLPLDFAGANINSAFTFRNFWNLLAGVAAEPVFWSTVSLRGGPALRGVDSYSAWLGGSSDERKAVRGSLNMSLRSVPESGSYAVGIDGQIVVQARSNLDIALGPTVSRQLAVDQYVTDTMNLQTSATEYILARLEQTTVALTVRLNYTFLPTLSLQLYAQPFISTGAYDRYKAVEQPRAERYDDRFHIFTPAEITRQDDILFIDRDGNGSTDYSFELADFNFRELRSNLVLRWEYLPGSTLFVVWSHQRSGDDSNGRFALDRELGALADVPGEHVLLAKLSYWYAL